MSTPDTNQLVPALAAAGAAAARCLGPDGPFAAGHAFLGLAPVEPGARAVAANLTGGLPGILTLVVSAELAAAVEQGTPRELGEALGPVLAEAATTLGSAVGCALHLGPPQEVGPELTADRGRVLSVPLGDGPAATLVLVIEEDARPGEKERRPGAHEFELLPLGTPGAAARSLELLQDVDMAVTAELGRTRMTVRDLLNVTPGVVIELDRSAGSPVDVLVNNTLIARGEVVVIDEEYGVRIIEIIGLNGSGNRAGA